MLGNKITQEMLTILLGFLSGLKKRFFFLTLWDRFLAHRPFLQCHHFRGAFPAPPPPTPFLLMAGISLGMHTLVFHFVSPSEIHEVAV